MRKRKIILNLCTSLEGYIEGANGEFDWCFTDQDYGMSKFLEGIDTIFLGRKCYELFENDISSGFPDKKQVIFSRTLKDKNIQIISDNVIEEVEKIRSLPGKDIWLFGGASLVQSLLELNLVDEMVISIHPLLLGSGKPLFGESEHKRKLKLIESQSFSSGLVQVRYEVKY